MTPAGISLLTSIYLGLFVGGIAFFWLWEDGAPLKRVRDGARAGVTRWSTSACWRA
jgi:hypothetical protein